MSALNWNYILFGGAALGLVVFFPVGVMILTCAVLNYISPYLKRDVKPKEEANGYFKEEHLYGQRVNW